MTILHACFFFFFFNDTATTEIYTLSLHDALPIFPNVIPSDEHMMQASGIIRMSCSQWISRWMWMLLACTTHAIGNTISAADRKSTRLNSSHDQISYAVFCLKKKKTDQEAISHLDS